MTVLRLPPRDFWALSLVEWRWLAGPAGGEAMTRAELTRLKQQHPDETHGTNA